MVKYVWILRVPQTVDDETAARYVAKGNLSRDYHEIDQARTGLTENGWQQAAALSKLLQTEIDGLVEGNIITDNRVLVIKSQSLRAAETHLALIGNKQPFQAINLPDEDDLRRQYYGRWHGLSHAERNTPEHAESIASFAEHGEFMGRPEDGEGKYDVFTRVGLIFRKSMTEADEAGIETVLFIADSGDVQRMLIACTRKKGWEYVRELRDVLMASIGLLVRVPVSLKAKDPEFEIIRKKEDYSWNAGHSGGEALRQTNLRPDDRDLALAL